MIVYVRGASGRLYELSSGWINLIDGLGRRVTGTCWYTPVNSPMGFPVGDQLWAMSLALQMDEERVWRDFPWRAPDEPIIDVMEVR